AWPDGTVGPQGVPQSSPVLDNDDPGDPLVPLDPASLTLLDAGTPVSSVTIPGEGTYTVDTTDPANPRIVFTPEPDFIGAATPVGYRVADVNGTTTESTYTPIVTPVAYPDTTSGPQGVTQVVDPLANDDPDGTRNLDPSTLRLVDPSTGTEVSSVTVPGVGTFTVVNGEIEFTPEPQLTGTGPSIPYLVDDQDGHTVSSTYTPTVTPVAPSASPDATSGPQGVPQSSPVLDND